MYLDESITEFREFVTTNHFKEGDHPTRLEGACLYSKDALSSLSHHSIDSCPTLPTIVDSAESSPTSRPKATSVDTSVGGLSAALDDAIHFPSEDDEDNDKGSVPFVPNLAMRLKYSVARRVEEFDHLDVSSVITIDSFEHATPKGGDTPMNIRSRPEQVQIPRESTPLVLEEMLRSPPRHQKQPPAHIMLTSSLRRSCADNGKLLLPDLRTSMVE